MFFVKRFKRKKHFQQALEDCKKSIAELELKKYTLVRSRARYAQLFDQANAAIHAIKELKNVPKERKEELKNIETQADNYKKVLEALDRELHGAQPSEELPNGVQGVDDQLKQWNDRVAILKEFIKDTC